MKKPVIGVSSILIGTIIWGSAFISQKVAMEHMGPFTFQAVRCLLAVAAMLLAIAIKDAFTKDGSTFFKRWADKKLWKAGILCGIPLFLACNLQQVGLVDTDPGKSGFLTAMYLVIVPIIGIFRGKKATIMIPISVTLAVVGMYCLSCVGVTQINPGDLLTLGCALAFAIQITIVDIYADNVDALRLNTIQSAICAGLSCIIMLITEEPSWNGIFTCSLELVHVGVLSMGLGYFLQIIGQRHLDTTPATLLMSLESVFAVVLGVLLLNEPIDFWKILGCCLIFAAVILCQIPIGPKKKVHSSN